MSTFSILRAGALGLTIVTCILAQNVNLSGVWRRNPQKSRPSGKGPADMLVRIEQNGTDITISMRVTSGGGAEEAESHQLRIGTDLNKNTIHGAPMVSQSHWEGSTLVVSSTATFGKDELRLTDRWTLSADRRTITFIQRHQYAAESEAEDMSLLEKQDDSSWQAEKARTAAEKYKNIQVFKDAPAGRIPVIMSVFTRALGVQCTHCHVPDAFDKDDKPAKNTARLMLTMTTNLNRGNPVLHGGVACWTCHRGNLKPETSPK